MTMARKPGGHDGPLCGAKKHQGEGNCTQVAGWGTTHVGEGPCKLHGGSTWSVSKGSHLRLVERKARAVMETYGLPIETSPADALLAEVHRTAGHVAWLQQRVAELEEHDLVWGTTQIKTGGEDGGTTEAAEPNVWLKLYQAERTHLVKVSAEAIRCGIEERRVKLAESQGALVAGVIRAILGDLNLSADQQALVSEVVPRHLRAVTAAGES
jgi:hypothetical protein